MPWLQVKGDAFDIIYFCIKHVVQLVSTLSCSMNTVTDCFSLHCCELQQRLAGTYLLGMCAALSSSDQRRLHLQSQCNRLVHRVGRQKTSGTSMQHITPSDSVDELSCHSPVSSAGCMSSA